MNQYSNTVNNPGLLKDYYDDKAGSTLSQALKKKREKLAETKIDLNPSSGDNEDEDNKDAQ